MFSQTDLDALRALCDSAHPDLCDIYDPPASDTRTPGGGFTHSQFDPLSWSKIGSQVACRLEVIQRQSEEGRFAGGVQGVTRYTLALPAGQTASRRSVIVITSLGSRRFQVTDSRADSYEVERLVEVVEV